jgi:hypothetical protein
LDDTDSGARSPSQSIYDLPVLGPNEDEIEEAVDRFMESEQEVQRTSPEALEN